MGERGAGMPVSAASSSQPSRQSANAKKRWSLHTGCPKSHTHMFSSKIHCEITRRYAVRNKLFPQRL